MVDSAATRREHRKFDAFGNLTDEQEYDAQGNPLTGTGAVDYIFAYTGRPLDTDTDLYDYRARWYDPNVGRFASEDPIDFAGGDMNLYRYCNNNPVINVDPSGLGYTGFVSNNLMPSFFSVPRPPTIVERFPAPDPARYAERDQWFGALQRQLNHIPQDQRIAWLDQTGAASRGSQYWDRREWEARADVGEAAVARQNVAEPAAPLPMALAMVYTDVGPGVISSDGTVAVEGGNLTGRLDSKGRFVRTGSRYSNYVSLGLYGEREYRREQERKLDSINSPFFAGVGRYGYEAQYLINRAYGDANRFPADERSPLGFYRKLGNVSLETATALTPAAASSARAPVWRTRVVPSGNPRTITPYRDPARPSYNTGATHMDHAQARALGGSNARSNLRPLAAETNLRKGGFEGELKAYEQYLRRNGMTREAARSVIQAEIDALQNSVVLRPMDPRVLDRLPENPLDQAYPY